MIAQVELKCVCGRVLKQTRSVMVERAKQGKPLRCLGCGKNLALPPDLLAEAAPDKAVKRVRTACPLCGAIVMAGNERGPFSGRCPDGCGVVFTCDEGGAVADEAVRPSARLAEIDKLAPRLVEKCPELYAAVKWRCSQSAVAPAEVPRTLDALDALAAWKAPPKMPMLPLPIDLAVPLIGPIVFRAPSSEVRAEGEVACLFEEAGQQLVTGLKVKAGNAAETHFYATNDKGSTSFVLKVYVDRTQQYFAAPDVERLVDIMFRARPRMEAFIRAQLVFGPLLQTGNWARLTRDAVVVRLKQAGVQQTDAVRVARDFLID